VVLADSTIDVLSASEYLQMAKKQKGELCTIYHHFLNTWKKLQENIKSR
jgi:hypothetical protein